MEINCDQRREEEEGEERMRHIFRLLANYVKSINPHMGQRSLRWPANELYIIFVRKGEQPRCIVSGAMQECKMQPTLRQ